MTTWSAKASIQIQKNVQEVFEAIVNADQMSNYFIEKASGNLEEDQTVLWKFREFEDEFPVTGQDIVPFQYISFDWSGGANGMLVEIFLLEANATSTIVRIKESSMSNDEQGILQAIGQTEGWANFLACLKAYLEHNINLRQGAFDFMKSS